MNKRGFTLIELLAVIVILAVIALIVTPVVTNIISQAKASADLRSAEAYVKATEDFYASTLLNPIKAEMLDNKTNVFEELTLSGNKATSGYVTIDQNGNITMSIVLNNKCYTKLSTQDINEIQVSNDIDNCNNPYVDTLLNGADPVLSDGMIPVLISDDGVVTKADITKEWYNYSNNKWANIVLVNATSREDYKIALAGTTIISTDILGYFVWIPRYKYQLFNATGADGTSSQEIQIAFENKSTPKSTGTTNGEWLTHPGFTFSDKELNGIWVAKFETTGTANEPSILPNSTALSNQFLSAQFTTSQKFNDMTKYGIDNDSHMARNSEWGAAAYLSYSKYGINSEIRINNNANGITGCGAYTSDASHIVSCEIAYGSNVSDYPQSTTGNITGIFDMSGGKWEAVMGNYSNTIGSSGFTTLPDSKYYETYTDNQNILGDALLETQGWYGDYNTFANSDTSWFERGGYNDDGISAGIWNFNSYYGAPHGYISFRVVLAL